MMSHRVQPITKTIDLHKHNLWEMKNRKYMQKIEIKIKMDLKKNEKSQLFGQWIENYLQSLL